MRRKSFLVVAAIVACLACAAQNKDIIHLLDAHDVLYYNRQANDDYRKSGVFLTKPQTTAAFDREPKPKSGLSPAAILEDAEGRIAKISNLPALRKAYPFAFAQYAMEYYALKAIVSLLRPGAAYDAVMLQYLDSVDYFNTIRKEERETALLRKETGIRWESLLEEEEKRGLHGLATNPFTGLLHHVLTLRFQSHKQNGAANSTNELTNLLDAHDLLLLSRTGGQYATASQRQTVWQAAEKYLSAIKNLPPADTLFSSLRQALHTERLYLKALLLADSADKTEDARLQGLDTAIAFFRQLPPYPAVVETKILRELAGVRYATLDWPAYPDVNRIILAYNSTVTQWLVKEYEKYQQTNTAKPELIDSLFSLQRPYDNAHRYNEPANDELQQSVDKNFLTAQAVAFYFKSRQAILENQCDKILLYTAGYRWVTALTSLQDEPSGSLLDASIKKVADSLALSCATDGVTSQVKEELEQQLWQWQQQTNTRPPKLAQSGEQGLSNARFPFPPPEPSRRTQPLVLKGNPKTWADADRLLMRALAKANYNQVSYYGINGGFAVVTPLEQLKDDASPKNDPPRYEVKVSLREEFSFTNYLKALFFGEKGYYRVLVFMFTNQPIAPNARSSGQVVLHLPPGLDRLPDEDAFRHYTPSHRCTVLVYEFEKAQGDPAKFKKPGRFDVKTHLSRTLIWNDLFY